MVILEQEHLIEDWEIRLGNNQYNDRIRMSVDNFSRMEVSNAPWKGGKEVGIQVFSSGHEDLPFFTFYYDNIAFLLTLVEDREKRREIFKKFF